MHHRRALSFLVAFVVFVLLLNNSDGEKSWAFGVSMTYRGHSRVAERGFTR